MNKKPNPKRTRDLGFYILLIVIMIAVIFTMTESESEGKIESYSELVDLFEAERVESFTTEGNTIILQVRPEKEGEPTETMNYELLSFAVFYEDFSQLIDEQYASGVLKDYDYTQGCVAPWWASMIP